MKKTMVAMSICAAASLTMLASSCFAWDVPDPPGGGLKLYAHKKAFHMAEPVEFMLYKHGNTVDDVPARLKGSYYIIERRQGNRGVEFYTSRRNPFGTSLNLDTECVWTWDQRDNERENRTRAGQYRIKFYAPQELPGGPLVVPFRIKP